MHKRLLLIQLSAVSLLFGLLVPKLEARVEIIIILLPLYLLITTKTRSVLFLLFPVVFLFLGLVRGFQVHAQLGEFENYRSKNVNLIGTVEEDAIYGYKRQSEFFVSSVSIDGDDLPGRVRVSGYGPIEILKGDTVQINGELRDGFGSYQGTVGFAEYVVLSRSNNPINKIRSDFIAASYTQLPEPHASLGLGFLAGLRNLLPEQLEENLSTTGLTHIVAVSGYNTTIIASAVHSIVARRGTRWQVVMATLGVLAVFITITGAAPSIMRASVVSLLALAGWYFGKKFKPSVLLLVSAAITAWINPLLFWFSLGWWLSFLAFFGVLVIAPTISARFFKKKPKLLLKTALETTSAQLMTLPLIIWVFGEMSLIAVIANMLVLPAIPIAMLFTFLTGILALTWPALASIMSWSATLILGYITEVIDWLAQAPWALVSLEMSKLAMFGSYALILVFVFVIKHKVALLKRNLYTLY